MSDFTGRPVQLRGEINLTLFPSPVAEIMNVTVPAKSEGDTPFAEVENVKVNIAPLTLLSSRPRITGFELRRPRINLVQSADGSINWNDGLGRIASAATLAKKQIAQNKSTSGDTETRTKGLLSDRFPKALGRIEISGGMISVVDPTGREFFAATAVTGALAWPSLDGPGQFDGSLIVRGLPLTISLSANKPLAMMAGETSNTEIALGTDVASMTFGGTFGYFGNMFADGEFAIDIQSMPALLEFLDAEIAPGKALNQVSAKGPIVVNNGAASFENIEISINDNVGTGVLEIASDDEVAPQLTGTLDFESLNLTSFLGAFIEIPFGEFASREAPDLNFLSQLRADLRVSAAQAQLNSVQMTNVAATAQINESAAIFDLGDAEAYGGNVQARLQFANNASGSKRMQISMSAQQVDAAEAAQNFDLPANFPVGVMTLSLDADAPYGSWNAMLSQATGITSLQMESGLIAGFGIARLLEEDNADQFFNLSNAEAPVEPFDGLLVSGELSDGVININNAEINYPNGAITFEGVAPLRSGGIALTATATPAQAADDDPATQPKRFFIGGSWDRAFATPLLPARPPLQ